MESFIKSGKQLLEKPMVRSWSLRHRGGARLSMRRLVVDDEVVGGTPNVIACSWTSGSFHWVPASKRDLRAGHPSDSKD